MGGTIAVESEPDKGTTVTLDLTSPFCGDDDTCPDEAKADLAILQGKRVLLCEDNPLNAEIASRILEMQGVTTETAENGQIGVNRFAAGPPHTYDAILMDVPTEKSAIIKGKAGRYISVESGANAASIPKNTVNKPMRCLYCSLVIR